MVLGPLDGDVGVGPEPEDDLPVVRLRAAVPGDVEVAAPRGQPGELAVEGAEAPFPRRLAELDAADAGLAEVVPAGPGEVADDVGVLEHPAPPDVDVGRVGLAGDDDPLGMGLGVLGESAVHVVVAGDVEVGAGLVQQARHQLALLGRAHEVAEGGRGRVDTRVLGDRLRRHRVPHRLDDAGPGDHDPADRLGDVAGRVERPHQLGLGPGPVQAGGRGPVGDLVADAVHDHARVVDVPADHGLDVGLPPVVVAGGRSRPRSSAGPTCRRTRPSPARRDGHRRRASPGSSGCGRCAGR